MQPIGELRVAWSSCSEELPGCHTAPMDARSSLDQDNLVDGVCMNTIMISTSNKTNRSHRNMNKSHIIRLTCDRSNPAEIRCGNSGEHSRKDQPKRKSRKGTAERIKTGKAPERGVV